MHNGLQETADTYIYALVSSVQLLNYIYKAQIQTQQAIKNSTMETVEH